MALKHVRQPTIIKIALLLAILASLPKTIFLYDIISQENPEFSGLQIIDLSYRLVFFFLFSWSILELNANISYSKFKWSTPVRISFMVLLNVTIFLIALSLFNSLYPVLLNTEMTPRDKDFSNFTFGNLLIALSFIGRILRLQVDKQESRIENEHLKQQSLQNELMALRNQIDPHFLFNSLNSLTSLIRENEKATQFVRKLSLMYRYILKSGESDLVSLKEELKFLESYTYLIRTRYRDRFSIDIQIEDKLLQENIPPLALQLLVENAVKHNEISKTNPLKVDIYSKNGSVFVENIMKPRTTISEGTKHGLANLKKRYILLRNEELTVRTENNIFSVELPVKKVA
ncbi:sensor histidine kinase [Allomuricauda sp. F6463D]|uniref:sensor histidine kinase n=1 Tax=Allomuricauda sp. F6463D TaxID=2926409 RepID=UPI001FF15DFA|nr:histidine kinase [Muricauda sp. F6463D]MCK0159163.1 histidine kinase [Muricauda sp. F6463D]